MLEGEKLSGTNFNDWFRQLRIILKVEKKLNVIEQPMTPALVVDAPNNELEDWNALYDVHNEELKSMFEKRAGVERFDLIQTFHACKQEEGWYVTPQVLTIQGGRIQKSNKKPQAAKGKGKGKGKGKNKLAYSPNPKNPSPAKIEHPTKDTTWHYYKEVGH
ncbi:hypothetical protein Tco_1441466 [Tanacetum coccineum]